MSSFHVGQKVVCVDDSFSHVWTRPYEETGRPPLLPTKGEVYTVRGVRLWEYSDSFAYGIYLAEIVNPTVEWDDDTVDEEPFYIGRFRPVVERKTDISIFQKLLVTSKQPMNVE